MASYNDETVNKICKFLEDGNLQDDAARLAGISPSTFYEWKKDENRTFRSQVEASISIYKQKLIQIVNVSSIKDGKLALEVLSRRWPDEFGGKQKIEIVPPEEKIKQVMDLIEGKDEQVPDNNPGLLQGPVGESVPIDEGSE